VLAKIWQPLKFPSEGSRHRRRLVPILRGSLERVAFIQVLGEDTHDVMQIDPEQTLLGNGVLQAQVKKDARVPGPV
jgi:hypothetical protein